MDYTVTNIGDYPLIDNNDERNRRIKNWFIYCVSVVPFLCLTTFIILSILFWSDKTLKCDYGYQPYQTQINICYFRTHNFTKDVWDNVPVRNTLIDFINNYCDMIYIYQAFDDTCQYQPRYGSQNFFNCKLSNDIASQTNSDGFFTSPSIGIMPNEMVILKKSQNIIPYLFDVQYIENNDSYHSVIYYLTHIQESMVSTIALPFVSTELGNVTQIIDTTKIFDKIDDSMFVVMSGSLFTGCKGTQYSQLNGSRIRTKFEWLLNDNTITTTPIECPYDNVIIRKDNRTNYTRVGNLTYKYFNVSVNSSVFLYDKYYNLSQEYMSLLGIHYPIITNIKYYMNLSDNNCRYQYKI